MSDTAATSASAKLDAYLGGRDLDELYAAFDKDGYVVLPEIMPHETIQAIRSALEPHMVKEGRNNFEGLKTNRVYGLLAKSPIFADLAEHPLALAFARRELGASFLLSACLAINLHSGETVQPWHSDDGYVHIPPPRRACAVSAFWTIDETTEKNGATEILPGSHLWGADHPDRARLQMDAGNELGIDASELETPVVKVTMPAGSLMLAKGTLVHRGGANTTDTPRLILTPQYCAGWVRQIENMMISVPPEIAASYSERVRAMLGYSVHPPFIGYVDGMHPARHLPDT